MGFENLLSVLLSGVAGGTDSIQAMQQRKMAEEEAAKKRSQNFQEDVAKGIILSGFKPRSGYEPVDVSQVNPANPLATLPTPKLKKTGGGGARKSIFGGGIVAPQSNSNVIDLSKFTKK